MLKAKMRVNYNSYIRLFNHCTLYLWECQKNFEETKAAKKRYAAQAKRLIRQMNKIEKEKMVFEKQTEDHLYYTSPDFKTKYKFSRELWQDVKK